MHTPQSSGVAAARWRRLVSDRHAEMERLAPDRGLLDGSFWDRRAERFAEQARADGAHDDPFLRRLRRVTHASSSVTDVGAGTGRYALALAREAAHVTAVDPSAGMLAILRRDAQRLGLTNVSTVQASWQEAGTAVADIVACAFVLPLVADAPAFLTKLDGAARDHVFLYLGSYSADAVLDPLWRHFHGAPRVPGATYLDALAVLRELGIRPDVRVVETPNRRRFATLREAVDYYRDGLLLADTPQIRAELEALLGDWLLGRRGALRSPLRAIPAAIIHWTPGDADHS